MKNVLLIDIGSTFTKVTAVDLVKCCVLGTAKAFTTVDTDICQGLDEATRQLFLTTGELEFSEKLASSSAAGGLKMVAIGLVKELTVQAAKMAALSAGARLMKTYAYDLSEEDKIEIEALAPDIVLLCGGTNGGNFATIVGNAKVLANSNLKCPIVVAGNKSAKQQIEIALKDKSTVFVENVMPEFEVLNIEPAQMAIREIFLKRIIKAKGITKVQQLVDGILMPTPAAVLKGASLLAQGTKNQPGIGDLVLIDIGGATTDVFSICSGLPTKSGVIQKGLPEAKQKRTVEGDLGARYSVEGVLDAVGKEKFCELANLTLEEVDECVEKIAVDKSTIATEEKMEKFDSCICSQALNIALARHAGSISTAYTPMGAVYIQVGKDLSSVGFVIGTGGPIVNSKFKKEVLTQSISKGSKMELLTPLHPEFGVDKKYIFAAMGLLSERYAEEALAILKNEMEWL